MGFLGGTGGNTGYYQFLQIGKNISSEPKRIWRNGKEGRRGLNGRICKTSGQIVQARCFSTNFLFGSVNFHVFSSQPFEDTHCPARVVRTHKATKIPNVAKRVDTMLLTYQYKEFLLESMMNPITFQLIKGTYDAINSNELLNSQNTLENFAAELNSLEQVYGTLKKIFDMLPLYVNLLRRIHDYSIRNYTQLSTDDREIIA